MPDNLQSAPVIHTTQKPTASPFWKWVMRLSGLLAMALFLAPTVYAVKYYVSDKPREERRAREVSLARLAPEVNVDSIAPPLSPGQKGNAAAFYVPAMQSFAARAAQGSQLEVPTAREAQLFLSGAQRRECRFFAPDPNAAARFSFYDADSGRTLPYRYPLTADEKYRYLSAAAGLAVAMARVPRLPGPTGEATQEIVGKAIVRFGDCLGRERATRTHLAVATAVERVGLRLLLPHTTSALRRYVDSLQLYNEAVQAKYRLLEPANADNLALQERVARHDADPLWRREAVWAIAATLRVPYLTFVRPLETLTAKATLSTVATTDTDVSVRAAAAAALGAVAQGGAVIRR